MSSRRRKLDPEFIEAELIAGLSDDLKAALTAMECGAVEEARRLIGHRHNLSVSLKRAEDDYRSAVHEAAPDLFIEALQCLEEAAEASGDPVTARAAEDIALLFSAGQGDLAAVLLAAGAAPIRQALAQPAEAGETEIEE